MALRARKPEIKEARLKTILYANAGVGKTHFCCSIPETYYIDTEGMEDYPHLVNMLKKNGGEIVYLTDIEEIIKEVKELLSVKHQFKTLIIDSISFPYAWLAQTEAERLMKKTPGSEGTDYGANLAKAKRLVFKLGMLLSKLDMNVIVVSHEKAKFVENKDAGKTFDISDKLAYSLGSVWNMRLQGRSRKLFVEKSRYAELQTNDLLDFDNGYEVIKNLFGESIFLKASKAEKLATKEQVHEIERLIDLLKIPEETYQKWKNKAKSETWSDMPYDAIEKCIEHLNKIVKGEDVAENVKDIQTNKRTNTSDGEAA
jgi:hypothetical protein